MKYAMRLILMSVVFVLLAACSAGGGNQTTQTVPEPATGETAAPGGPEAVLNVLTHDSFAVSQDVIDQFQQENQVKVNFIPGGDTGAAVNRAILSKNSPLADVFYGVDNTFLSRALAENLFEPYNSPLLSKIPAEFKLDPSNQALPVDYGDVCINYDKAYFQEKGLPVPTSLEELTDPKYASLLAVENPATSSPGLSFLLATIAHFGEGQWQTYWQQLRDNGVVVVNDWETAYYTNFSGSTGQGQQPMVVSYASSPVAEVVFAEQRPAEPPTASIIGPDTCFRQIEFVGILKGTQQRALAEKFVDFMLGQTFQEDMPLQMFVFPVNPDAVLPEDFQQIAQVPEQPARIDPAVVQQNRDAWIQAWTEIVLQ